MPTVLLFYCIPTLLLFGTLQTVVDDLPMETFKVQLDQALSNLTYL